jgi:hypothetical protein
MWRDIGQGRKELYFLTMLDKMQNVSNSAGAVRMLSRSAAELYGAQRCFLLQRRYEYLGDAGSGARLCSTADIYVSGGVVRAIEVSH